MGLLAPILAFVLVGYVLPGLLVLLLSAGHPPSFVVRFANLDWASYVKFASTPYYPRVLGYTVLLSVVVGCIAAVFGYPVAYFLARSRSWFQKALFFLTLTPMAVGINMLTLGWMIVLGKNGFVNSVLLGLGMVSEPLRLMFNWTGVIIGLTHVTFTFMVLPIASVLKNIDPALELAARNLGAGPVRTFLHVTLPLSVEGIAAGFLIVFMLSAGAFVLPLLMGGGGFMVLPILIWEQVTVALDNAFAATIAAVLLGFALAILWFQMRYFRLGRSQFR